MTSECDPCWALRPGQRLPLVPPLLSCVDPECIGPSHYLVGGYADGGGWCRASDARPPVVPDGSGWALLSPPKEDA